jgi:hypothetical protein
MTAQDQADRLLRAFLRDVSSYLRGHLDPAEAEESHKGRYSRMHRSWERLSEASPDVAGFVAHTLASIGSEFAWGSATGERWAEISGRYADEFLGVAAVGRAANPDAEVRNLGELHALGEAEIQRQIDEDTGGTLASEP